MWKNFRPQQESTPAWISCTKDETSTEPNQTQSLSKSHGEEHVDAQEAGELRLTSRCFMILGADEANADARTESSKTVADGRNITDRMVFFPFVVV